MNGDIFVNNRDKSSFSNQGDNFFMQPENIPAHTNQTEPVRRLNDYDYNILKEEAYKDVSDELFKLEYKISKAEEELKSIDAQIQGAKDIRDFELVESLFGRRKQVQDDLNELLEIYNETSLSAKISGGIINMLTSRIKEKCSGLKKLSDMIGEACLSRLPKRFSSVLELKKSLSKLENINKSVDELMTLQTPYGEALDKYEQLSRYITRANTIQAQISKQLGKG